MKKTIHLLLAILLCAASLALEAAVRPVVFVKSAPALCGNTSLTIEGWFLLKDLKDYPRLLSKYGHLSPDNRGWEISLENGIPAFRLNCLFVDGTRQDVEIKAQEPLTANKWTHIAAVFADEGNGLRYMSLFVDGKCAATRRLPDNCSMNPNSSINIFAGTYAESQSGLNTATMYLDELRFIARPLNYQTAPTAPFEITPDTLALFHFDGLDSEVFTAPGIIAGIEGKPNFVDGQFDLALDLTGEIDTSLFALANQRGRELLLDEKLEADFRLALHDGQTTAKLLIINKSDDKPLQLTGTLAPEDEPGNIIKDFSFTVQDKYVLTIDPDELTDGRYLVTLRYAAPKAKTDDTLVRLLRLQRQQIPQPPAEPILVSGEKIFPVDNWHFASFENVETCATTVTAPVEMSSPSLALQRTLGDDWLGEDAQGNQIQNFVAQDFDGNTQPMQWGQRAPDGTITILDRPPENFQPYPVAQFAPTTPDSRFTRSDLPTIDKSTVRFLAPEDGLPPLSEIRVQCMAPHVTNAPSHCLLMWATYAVWEKTPGELIILNKEPLCTCKFGFTEREIEQTWASNDNFGGQWLSDDGKTIFYAQAAKFRRFAPFTTDYDNIPLSFRQMRIFYSHDGINWQYRYVMIPDENDHPFTQHYGCKIYRIEKDFYVAVLANYNLRTQQICPEIWFSRNCLDWQRPAKRGFLVNNTSTPGSWLFGMIFAIDRCPILEKDGNWFISLGEGWNRRPHFYFSYGSPSDPSSFTPDAIRKTYQNTNITTQWPFFNAAGGWEGLSKLYGDFANGNGSTVGYAKLRRDGFFAAKSQGRGILTTRLLNAQNCQLLLNGRGNFTVELLDADNRPLPGFSGQDAATFSGDDCAVLLSFGDGTTQLPNTSFKLRLTLGDGTELYSLYFLDASATE